MGYKIIKNDVDHNKTDMFHEDIIETLTNVENEWKNEWIYNHFLPQLVSILSAW